MNGDQQAQQDLPAPGGATQFQRFTSPQYQSGQRDQGHAGTREHGQQQPGVVVEGDPRSDVVTRERASQCCEDQDGNVTRKWGGTLHDEILLS
ncbi:hypothetical protein PSEUDO8O_140182 [Pseudomonas sp. 8O]|nr:hypothetical protein PSEUDO8O_140182 [Pseudomonas sp. 8O]